jgi:hypothetical protein
VRGDAALTARLLLRPQGLAGLAAVVGGAVAVTAARRSWYVAVAELSMLGEEQRRVVGTLPGIPSTLGGWAAVGLGALAIVVGAAVALDRPPAHAPGVLAGCGVALGLLALAAWLRRPPLSRVLGEETPELVALAERLPVGLDLAVAVAPGSAPAWLTAAAAAVAMGGYFARDLAGWR